VHEVIEDDEAPAVADLEAEIRDLLDSAPPGGFRCEHGDLGYGFGAWSSEFLRCLGERDLIGVGWPKGLGGRGRPVADVHLVLRTLAYERAPAEALLYSLAVGYCVYTFGDDDLKERFLPRMLRGELTFAEGLSEPGAGSDLLALRTTARRDGDDWVVTGSKIWTSNGWLADYALVVARTDPEAPRHLGISALLVDLTSEGVVRRPILDMVGEPSFSEIFFDSVRVPASNLVGEAGQGLRQVLDALEWDRLWGRCVKSPFLRREMEDLIAYCRSTRTSRGLIWDDAVVRDEMAKISVEIDVCDALFWRAVRTVEETGASGTHEVSIAKVFADELGQRFYQMAQETLGMPGVVWGETSKAPLGARMLRGSLAAHGLLLAGGTPEIQRSTIARRHLGLGARS
jgi:alkylation response protein AidB-like acyl-CoA dehydrogenase